MLITWGVGGMDVFLETDNNFRVQGSRTDHSCIFLLSVYLLSSYKTCAGSEMIRAEALMECGADPPRLSSHGSQQRFNKQRK